IPSRRIFVFFSHRCVFYQHIPSSYFPQFGVFTERARNNKIMPHEKEASSQQSREPAFVLCGLATVRDLRKASFRRPNRGDSNYFTHRPAPVQASLL
ncbi:hypothetical protein, partial [Arthrobacter koreensis]|uniref:hypothetical protein n=1 Tax=Arthrobacter koreensis TaxID=199136 RepID=UPI0031D92887